MATVTNLSGTSALTNYIDSEFISRAVNLAVQTPKIYQELVEIIPMGPGMARTYTHVIRTHLTAAAAVTESDEVAAAALADSQLQVSVSLVAKAVFVTEQAQGAVVGGPAQLISDGVGRVVDATGLYIDDAVHNLSTSISATMGNNATTHDLTNWATMVATYAAAAKNVSSVAFVGHPDQIRDLREDVMTSAAAGLANPASAQLVAQAARGFNQGLQFLIGDVPVYSTDEIPAGDTTGWAGYLTATDERPLGLVVKRGIRVDTWMEPKRFGVWLIASADLGAGIIYQSRLLQVISKT